MIARVQDPVRRRWRNAVFTIFFLSGFAFATWVSRIPEARDVLGASTDQMGLLLFAIAAGAMTGLLVSSHVVAALGATRTILLLFTVATGGLIAAGLLGGLAPTFVSLGLALAVLGFGNSIVDVAMNLSGAANERAIGRTLMPLFHAMFSLGTVAGAGVGALTIAVGVPLLVHVAGVGAVAMVVNFVLVRFLQPEHADAGADAGTTQDAAVERRDGGWRSRLAVWRDGRLLLVGLIVLGMAFAEGSANDWLALAMVDGYGVRNEAGAAIFGIFVAAMTVGRVAGVPLLDRFGRVPVLRASAALAVVGLVLVILGPNVWVAIVGTVLWGLGAALGFPVGMSAAADDPRRAAASVSAVATIGYVAFLVGPPLIGLLGERFELLPALTVVLVLVLASGLASPAAREPAKAAVPR